LHKINELIWPMAAASYYRE